MPLEPRFTITNRIAATLSAIERARGFLDAATLSETWVQRMSSRALLLEAHHTTHIEGTQLTVEQSEHPWAGEAAILDAIAAEPDLGIRRIGDRVGDSNRRTLQRDRRRLVDRGLSPNSAAAPPIPAAATRVNPQGTAQRL